MVVPAVLQREMMATCHATHIGVEGCVRRARESMFWPRMSTELKDYVSKCDVYMAYRAQPTDLSSPQRSLPPLLSVGASTTSHPHLGIPSQMGRPKMQSRQ